MKRGIEKYSTQITVRTEREGESLEQQLRRMTKEGEPIEGGAHVEYNERKLGVLPQYDIRTDRFEIARQAMDKVAATNAAQRQAEDFPELNSGEEQQKAK